MPGVFFYLFAATVYVHVKYDNAHEAILRSIESHVLTGAASAVSIVILWMLARDDEVYHDRAVIMSLWGGVTVVVAALYLVKIATPRGRKNMRDQREAVARGEDPWSKPSS